MTRGLIHPTSGKLRFREYAHGSTDCSRAICLRQAVLRTPLGLRFSESDLAAEAQERHFGCFAEDGKVIATLCLRSQGEGHWKMRQVAVAAEAQGQGLGAALVQYVESLLSGSEVTLHARLPVLGFYEKLGYAAEGPVFEEVTLPHRKMRKRLPADAKERSHADDS